MPTSRILRRSRLAACLALLLALGAAGAETLAPDGGAELAAALAAEADLERGQTAYAACATCHGPDGAGRPDGTFPQLAGQHASVIAKQLVDIRSGRRANPVMLPYALRLMDSQEIADIAGYLSTLRPPPDFGRGPGTDLQRGGALFRRDCARCHGEHGEGDATRNLPALSGQHYAYLLRQARDISAGRRGNAHPEMAALLQHYDDADLRALVDYASRLERADPAAPGTAQETPNDD